MAESFLDKLFAPSRKELERRAAEGLKEREVAALEKIAEAQRSIRSLVTLAVEKASDPP